MYKYKTQGVCSQWIDIETEGSKIKSVKFTSGCNGNLQGICKLVQGMDIDYVISSLKGIKCKGNTSCPDQLATALTELKLKQQH